MGDGASLALEADIGHRAFFYGDSHFEPVTAGKILRFTGIRRVLKFPEITRVAVVVEDEILVEGHIVISKNTNHQNTKDQTKHMAQIINGIRSVFFCFVKFVICLAFCAPGFVFSFLRFKYLPGSFYRLDQRIDILRIIIYREADPCGSGETELAVDRRGAVLARADADAFFAEDLREVVRMDVLECEGNEPGM